MKVFVVIAYVALVASAYGQEPEVAIPQSFLGNLWRTKARIVNNIADTADRVVHNVKSVVPIRFPNLAAKLNARFQPTAIPRPGHLENKVSGFLGGNFASGGFFPQKNRVDALLTGQVQAGNGPSATPATESAIDCAQKDDLERELQISLANLKIHEENIYKNDGLETFRKDVTAAIANKDSNITTADLEEIEEALIQEITRRNSAQANVERLYAELKSYESCP